MSLKSIVCSLLTIFSTTNIFAEEKLSIEKLNRLEKLFIEKNNTSGDEFQSGASIDELKRAESAIGVKFTQGLSSLYMWKNGQANSYANDILFNFKFMSLHEVVTTKKIMDEMIGSDFEDPNWWKKEWIPFLDNGAGDNYVVDTVTGKIIWFWHDDGKRNIIADSLEAWLDNTIIKYEENEYR